MPGEIGRDGKLYEIGTYQHPCYDSHAKQLFPVLFLLPRFSGTSTKKFDFGLASIWLTNFPACFHWLAEDWK
jgi:hypothetical protein